MFVRQMLPSAHQHLATVGENASLGEVAKILCHEHINLVVVCDAQGTMVGVITDSDVVRCVCECDQSSHYACRAKGCSAMTTNVVSCRSDDALSDIWSMMNERGLRHVPVLDDHGKPIGVLYLRDVSHELFKGSQLEEEKMREYILGVGYH